MDDDSLLPLELPAVARKKVTLAFDGGRLSSDAGVLLLREVERALGIAERLAACVTDRREAAKLDHTVVEMFKTRMFAIAAGFEDADDCDALRDDPVFKMAVGRAPQTGAPLCSQPTMSRLENAPSKIEIARMMAAMVALFCDSWARPPASITLDIDDTLDAVHGRQQLSLFHAHYDARCFLPIHIYEATSGKPVARHPARRPHALGPRGAHHRQARDPPHPPALAGGAHPVARRRPLRATQGHGLVRGQRRRLLFGLAGNDVVRARIRGVADDLCVRRAEGGVDKLRGFRAFDYAAKSWRARAPCGGAPRGPQARASIRASW